MIVDGARSWSPRLGQHVEAARIRAGMNRAQLAGRLDVSEETIRRWERGGSQPGAEHLTRLLVILAIDGAAFTKLEAEHDEEAELPQRLRAERASRGISQAVAGELLGVAQATYAGWEIGRATPARSHVKAIASFLGLREREVLPMLTSAPRRSVATLSPLGRLLVERRRELRLDRDALAKRMGVAARTVQAWESGEKAPRDQDVPYLAQALEVGVEAVEAVLAPRDAELPPLGRVIRRRQRLLGLSRASLAERAGIDQATISRWVHGRHEPDESKLAQLAGALEVDVADLRVAAS